jgi:FkbM family methyltransferase
MSNVSSLVTQSVLSERDLKSGANGGLPFSVRSLRSAIQGLCRWYPLLSGCTQLANQPLAKRLTSQDELVTARLRDGSMIRLQLNDYGGRSMFYFGDYDPKVTRVLKRVLRSGDNVVDMGANFGLITLMSAKLVGSGGVVHAFEPQRELASLISQSANLNGYKQVHVHPYALSDRSGELEMYTQPGLTGAASLVRENLAQMETRTVSVVKTDEFLHGLGLKGVRLLKIDVEGHEHTVLSCALDWLKEIKPEAILFETQDSHIPFRDRDVVRLLETLGYEFYPVGKAALRLTLTKDSELESWKRDHAHDVLAIHRDGSIRV